MAYITTYTWKHSIISTTVIKDTVGIVKRYTQEQSTQRSP